PVENVAPLDWTRTGETPPDQPTVVEALEPLLDPQQSKPAYAQLRKLHLTARNFFLIDHADGAVVLSKAAYRAFRAPLLRGAGAAAGRPAPPPRLPGIARRPPPVRPVARRRWRPRSAGAGAPGPGRRRRPGPGGGAVPGRRRRRPQPAAHRHPGRGERAGRR